MSTETNHTLLPVLPETFAEIKENRLVERQLAGLLELVDLDEASHAVIEKNYHAARNWGGMYENAEVGCLCFDSGLQTFSGKQIYIGIAQRDGEWTLDCAIRRSADAVDTLGTLLLPNDGSADGTPQEEESPIIEEVPSQEPSPVEADSPAEDETPAPDAAPLNTHIPVTQTDAFHDQSRLPKDVPEDETIVTTDPVENSDDTADEADNPQDSVETPVDSEQNSPIPATKEVVRPESSAVDADYTNPPASWSEVLFLRHPTQEFLAEAMGYEDKLLPKTEYTQIFRDYTKAVTGASDCLRRHPNKPKFFFLLSRKSAKGEPLVLALTPNRNPNGGKPDSAPRPWFCNLVFHEWPPKRSIPVFGTDEEALPAEPAEEIHDQAPETPAAPQKLNKAQMQQIYNTLVPPYRPGETVLLSQLGQQLSTHGIKCANFGYSSILQLFSDLPELFTLTSTDPNNLGARTYSATILPWPEEEPETEKKPTEAAPTVDTKPPFSMTDRTIQFPANQQDVLSRLVNGRGMFGGASDPLTPEQLAEFRSSYDAAVAEGKLEYDADYECYRFPLTILAEDGSAISATIKHGATSWYVSYIKKEQTQGVPPGKRLLAFAYLGDKQEFLRSLAEHAEPEQWSFSGKPDDYSILWNYIIYTFYRLEFENKIVYDEEGRYAAFDTGLLSRRFGDPLYAVFEPNTTGFKSKWKFNCFCSTFQEGTTTERNIAAKLVVKPQMPSYFTNIYDTLFDPDAEMQINFEHIFQDNLERFPLRWVHAQCDSWPRTQAIMQQIDAVEAQIADKKKMGEGSSTGELKRQRSELYRQLGAAVNDTSDDDMQTLFDNMTYNLRGCIEKTLMRSRRNHQLAEPCYLPTRNVMSMLLPIRLFRSDTPDLALVLERQTSTVYIGRTVITMAMAYRSARLLRRFTSDWLNNYAIQDDDDAEDMDVD
jgi:hypothetical protein